MVVVAHPDDEVIGAGALMGRLAGATVVHVTDGAPRDLVDALAAGYVTASAYAEARRREAEAALALLPNRRVTVVGIGVPDQTAALALVPLAHIIHSLIADGRTDVVLTHAFEGGHPDHDAVAFAVHAAARLTARSGRAPPRVVEFASYHGSAGALAVGDFLPGSGPPAMSLQLSPDEQALKRQMLRRFETQARTLRPFLHPLAMERFRTAPRYRFTHPAHAGRLWYDWFGWGGVTGERWCALAAAALADLELAEPL
jgi:LmbE family N-acetylglucosaminyl deacetylase